MSWFSSSKPANNAEQRPQYTALQTQTSAAGLPITIFWRRARLAPNLIWAPGGSPAFQTIAHVTEQQSSGGGKGFGGGGGCFAGDTIVAAPGGGLAIRDIVSGDLIWSIDPKTGAARYGTVKEIHRHRVADTGDRMLHVVFMPRSPGRLGRWARRLLRLLGIAWAPPAGSFVHVTERHYLWLDGLVRREARAWTAGDLLRHVDGGTVAITDIYRAPDVEETWNLTVEPHHNFFAGGILAHNGGGGGGGKGNVSYTYTQAVLLALGEGLISEVPTVYVDKSTTTIAALGLTLFTGTAGQSVFGYISTNYPDQALPYAFTAYLATGAYDLGTSANLPQHNFECIRDFPAAGPDGVDDASMADIIPDLLTNVQYGLGMDSGQLGDVDLYRAYTRAAGLWFSPVLSQQERCADIIDRWAALSNTWIFWHVDRLEFVPLGDRAITANGATFLPDVDPVCDIGYDDFIFETGEPVEVTIADDADLPNNVKLEILARSNAYNAAPIEWKAEGLVDAYGINTAPVTQAHEICDEAVGAAVAALIGQRLAYLPNGYAFKTNDTFCWLRPGKIVTLTEPHIGLDRFPARIKTIEEDENGDLSFVAEIFASGVGTATLVAPQAPSATPLNMRVAPGDVNAPAIIEPPSSATGGAAQVWIALSGGASWGGADVHLSFDGGTTYSRVGAVTNPARQGVLLADLASHADPDSSNTLSVDLTESAGTIAATATHDDADALRTLSLIGSELIAYGSAVPGAGTYQYDLTYLRRGAYGTPIAAHLTGATFTRLDDAVFKFDLPTQYIGQTLYLKFTSFNRFGLAHQDLATVTEYTYTPDGAGYGGGSGGVPTTPTGLSATPSIQANTLAWNANPSTDNVTVYKLYAGHGHSLAFGSCALVATLAALTWTHSGLGVADEWTYYLVAGNVVGDSGEEGPVAGTTLSTGADAVRVVTASGAVTVTAADRAVIIDKTVGAATTVNLPSGVLGMKFTVKDGKGDADANAITITPHAGDTIDGAATLVISNAYGATTITFGTEWSIS